jgi:transcriptional regulator with XRE-family HTH domain
MTAIDASSPEVKLTFQDPVKLRRRRMLSGRSQTDIARAAGISRAHMCNLESGKVGASAPTLKAIADEIGCSVADLARETL